MRKSKLPPELVDLGWKLGLSGRRVYIPKQPDHEDLVTRYRKVGLQEVEATYEEQGITFSERTRKPFSERFGKSKIAARHHLSLRTATRVASVVYRTWREWFSHKERLKLEQLRTIAQENGWNYTDLFFSYLKIRGEIRSGQEVDMEFYTGYHSTSQELIQPVIELAQSSIESCPWRRS